MSVLGLQIDYLVNDRVDNEAPQRMRLAFERAGQGFKGFGRVLFPQVLELLEEEEQRQFQAEGAGPNVGHWEPLTPTYAEWKAARYGDKPILEATGTLMDALTRNNSPFASREVSELDFAFGTEGVPYASFHQTGTERMHDRPPFDFGEPLERGIRAAAVDAAREVVKRSGLDEFADFEGD